MKIDFLKMTRDFILNEGQGPSVISYVQSLGEALNGITPRSIADARRLEMAKETLLNVRRHIKRLEDKINVLQEEVKTLQEDKIKKE